MSSIDGSSMGEIYPVDLPPPMLNAPVRQRPAVKSRFWLGFISGFVASLVVVAGIWFGLQLFDQVSPSPLARAIEDCGPLSPFGAMVQDDGNSLVLSTVGEDDVLGMEVFELKCVLEELNMPDSMWAEMQQTRALDGRQSGQWDNLSATWSYHPNSGLNVVVRR